MSLFGNWFGTRESLAPGAPPPFPYELIALPGEQAEGRCLSLRKEGRGVFWPVILGGREEVERLAAGIADPGTTPEIILELARTMDAEAILAELRTEFEEDMNPEEPEIWPSEAEAAGALVAPFEILSGQPRRPAYIAKVPAEDSFAAPAWLRFGGWNECPIPERHVALFRRWQQRYGAEIISVTGDIIECTVERPPADRDAALKLAWEQYTYCPDIVWQGVGTVTGLGATLLNNPYWYFWWD
jgi:hypothetical protein